MNVNFGVIDKKGVIDTIKIIIVTSGRRIIDECFEIYNCTFHFGSTIQCVRCQISLPLRACHFILIAYPARLRFGTELHFLSAASEPDLSKVTRSKADFLIRSGHFF